MKKPLLYLAKTLPLTLLLSLICYYLVDQPVAIWAHSLGILQQGLLSQHNWAFWLTQVTYCSMLPLFIVYFIFRTQGRDDRFTRCLGLFCSTVGITYFIKSLLQFMFGRYAPRYYQGKTLLFIHNPNFYGFHWLHNGGSFPSGHMAMFSAGLLAICLYYPRAKFMSLVLLSALALLLLLLNYHFVSDIIAGTYLGASITLALYYLSRLDKNP